jgi:LuxR family transcriptional regulator, maltose regulon positive regulatory protein
MASMPTSRPSSVESFPLDDLAVDTCQSASLSFPPPKPASQPCQPTGPRSQSTRPPIAVGPGRLATAARPFLPGGLLGAMPEYPIQISKVQAPPLRAQTLARDRLLDWLSVKVHSRAVLVIAEAGYGKTTLLADFSRRTRVRTLWFRLDHGDRDWVGFIAHLVAAVRIHAPGFGPATDSLLRETASSSPPRDTVLDTFLRELGDLPADASALIFDDFHLVDDAPDIRHIARELLARAPERLSFVFASRRMPPLRLARLRALGELAELGTDDLRFDQTETERLFRETYEMRLEPGLVAELSQRTEGWAASLQLVRTALHDRDPAQVRAFIRSLSGAEGHLYDYLAEEVIGDLPAELQQFLMRTSILDTVDLVVGPPTAEVSAGTARRLIDDGERLGLFGRRGPQTRHQVRAHPLVRDFLQARLRRSVGAAGLSEIHRRAAVAAEAVDWRIAGHHHLAAGDEDAARRILTSSIETILATGGYTAAGELAASLSPTPLGPTGLIIASRIAQQGGDVTSAVNLAEQAFASDPESRAVLLNLLTARNLAGDVSGALEIGRILQNTSESDLAQIGRVYSSLVQTSLTGSLDLAATGLESLVTSLRARSQDHYLGVALSNLALIRLAMGDAEGSRSCSEEAISVLSASSAGVELVSARLARAAAIAHLGDIDGARDEIGRCSVLAQRSQMVEVAFEASEIEAFFGSIERAWSHLEPVKEIIAAEADNGEQAVLMRAFLCIRAGHLSTAESEIEKLRSGQLRTTVAFEVQRRLISTLLAVVQGDTQAGDLARSARTLAKTQGARLWEAYASLLEAATSPDTTFSSVVIAVAGQHSSVLSIAAEAILIRLDGLSDEAQTKVLDEACLRPSRWLPSTRRLMTVGSDARSLALARLLEEIGEVEDIKRLRDAGRMLGYTGGRALGRSLARRLAPHAFVEDLGRVRIVIGDRLLDGSDVRRKVLALLCLLLSRARFASTREEVLESIWPDLDPRSALNSLNQTAYFLRRVFEPDYREDLSPGYLQQDGETIWLDEELIDSRSRRCRELIRSMPSDPSPDGAARLAGEYRGKFALDFAYEEWASSFRDSLHTSYLRVIERAVRMDIDAGHFARGTFLAECAAEVEPDSEEIQVALLRLYRLSGAHAAAAEQYTHYAQTLRDLGVDPPPFGEI